MLLITMSDNVRLTNHDIPLAADEIAGAKHLKVKLEYGDNNFATEVSESNPLPVDIAGGTVNINVSSGNLNTVISSGLMGILSGQINITSGEIHVMSGQVNAFVQSGNIYINSGNINILNSGSVVSTTNPFPVTYIASGGGSALPVSLSNGLADAFGRMRVSNPFTIFDSQHRYQINDKWNYATSGSATTSFDSNGSFVNLTTGTASGNQVVAETKRVMPYQPGKSLLALSTFTMSAAQESLRQRVGYFGKENGIYFEVDGSTAYFVKRTSINGSVVDYREAQSAWNVDKLNGSGPSGLTLTNFSSSMIFYTDIEWLGVGDVRCGFIMNGQYIHCHTFKHSAVSSSPISGTYMTTACLPLRNEITNKATLTSGAVMKQICQTVISEGGYNGFSRQYNASLGTSEKNLATEGVLYPIVSLRLASGRTDSVIVPAGFNALVTSNQNVQYRLLFNATLSGSSWVTHSNGNVQYDLSATSLASGSGIDVVGGYVEKQGSNVVGNINDFYFQLGRTINGVSDTLTLAMAPTSQNTKVLADLSWYEIV